jgi:hypothetical protein
MLDYDPGAIIVRPPGYHFSAVGSRNGSETAIVTAENAKPVEKHLMLHVVDNTFDFHASHANISPQTWYQKSSPLFVAFVSATLNLDPKTYHTSSGVDEASHLAFCVHFAFFGQFFYLPSDYWYYTQP